MSLVKLFYRRRLKNRKNKDSSDSTLRLKKIAIIRRVYFFTVLFIFICILAYIFITYYYSEEINSWKLEREFIQFKREYFDSNPSLRILLKRRVRLKMYEPYMYSAKYWYGDYTWERIIFYAYKFPYRTFYLSRDKGDYVYWMYGKDLWKKFYDALFVPSMRNLVIMDYSSFESLGLPRAFDQVTIPDK